MGWPDTQSVGCNGAVQVPPRTTPAWPPAWLIPPALAEPDGREFPELAGLACFEELDGDSAPAFLDDPTLSVSLADVRASCRALACPPGPPRPGRAARLGVAFPPYSWDDLAGWRWGPAIGDPEPGIIIDRPDPARRRLALEALGDGPDV